jgi:hypothetical protein
MITVGDLPGKLSRGSGESGPPGERGGRRQTLAADKGYWVGIPARGRGFFRKNQLS